MGLVQSAAIDPNTKVWDMETGAGANRNSASLNEVISAFSDPSFFAMTRSNRSLGEAVRDVRTNGATIEELQRFDSSLRAVPGGIAAFERALESVAPHLLQEQR